MAVLDSLPGIEVAVCVDGEPLKEYENTEDELILNEPEGLGKKFEVAKHQRSVTIKKFVESTAGNFFTIKCTIKSPYRYTGASQWDNSIEADIWPDGNGRYVGEIEVRVFREMSPSKASLVSTAPLVRDLEALGIVERMSEPESPFGCGHDSRRLPIPMSGPQAPEKLFRVPIGSSNIMSPINSASWNLQDLDPTQTGQLFGQFLQYLQTQGGGEHSQAPPPLPVETTPAALPSLSKPTSSSEIVTTATSKPTVKREKEGNENESRKRRRKVREKITIDLTEDD
ncbi:hypothetical protein BELL_0036g00190 [Botrytis elliptica]|uniref:DUF7918 domain-containing protein n=1 Tax=Botrytis elliptica TaxID=278938 RepID=A0A4Z1K5N2_9HELO|nr:hypothetical protein BELL_0036g00190 [Botrytis elliptica]